MKIWRMLALALGCTFTVSAFTACEGIGGLFDKGDSSEEISSSQSSFVEEQDKKTTHTYNVTGVFNVAQTEEGADFQVNITAPELAQLNEQTATIVQMLQNVYFVDGYVYYNSGTSWAQSPATIWAGLEEEGADPREIQGAITEAINTLKEYASTSATISMSYKNEVNAILDYFGSLTPQTTLLAVTDKVLAFADTSIEDIKTYIIENEVGSKTLGEVHTMINDYLAENTEYADIDEAVEALLEKPEVAMMFEEIAGEFITVEEVVEMDLDAEIDKHAKMTVDEFLNRVIEILESDGSEFVPSSMKEIPNAGIESISTTEESEEENEWETITIEGLVTELEATLQETTLGDILPNDAWMTLAMCNAIEVTKCDITLTTEATFGEFNSAVLGFVFAVEVENIPNVVTEYVLNIDLTVTLVDEITAPSGVVYMCYECEKNNLEDSSVAPRENGYVLCDVCLEQMSWEICEYCYTRKVDAMFRTGEHGEGVYCGECAPLLDNIACEDCGFRETDIVVAYREELERYLCDYCYQYTWDICSGCYEFKQDAMYREDLGDIYCEECYAEQAN